MKQFSYWCKMLPLVIIYPVTAICQIPFKVDNFQWGETEVISLDKQVINKSDFLKDSPLLVNVNKNVTEDSIDKAFIWCNEKLKEKISPTQLACSMNVDIEAKLLNFVVRIANSPAKSTKRKNTESSLLLDPRLIQAHNKFIEETQLLWGTNRNLTQVIRQKTNGEYYIGYSDPKLDKDAEKLYKLVSSYKSHILDIVFFSEDQEDIRIALELLNWAGITMSDMHLLVDHLSDAIPEVMNTIFQLAIDFSFLIEKDLEIKLFNNSQRLSSILESSLCAKNLKIIEMLLIRNNTLKNKINKNTKEYIEYLACNSILPQIQNPAREITEMLLNNKT